MEILTHINAVSTVVVAAATGVLAWRELRRRKEQREAADTLLRARAWDLNYRLFHWEAESWPDRFKTKDTRLAKESIRFAKDQRGRFAGIRQILRAMLADLPDASPELRGQVRIVYARVMSVINELDRAAVVDPHNMGVNDTDLVGRVGAFKQVIRASRLLLEEEIQDYVDLLVDPSEGEA